jgi:hypothetical protein
MYTTVSAASRVYRETCHESCHRWCYDSVALLDAINPWHNKDVSMKNFHVPLPDETYERLKVAAAQSKMPATALGREAIDFWLRRRLREARHNAIAAFAVEAAGTSLDLDKELEAAAIEHLAKTGNALK